MRQGILSMIITIDGPSASGKSSVAQQLAQQLQLVHINSGYLYRAAAVVYLRLQASDQNKSEVQSGQTCAGAYSNG